MSSLLSNILANTCRVEFHRVTAGLCVCLTFLLLRLSLASDVIVITRAVKSRGSIAFTRVCLCVCLSTR